MKKKAADCCGDTASPGRYKVESIVSVDDRGQMVLPKEVREKLGIRTGDKLAVVVLEREGGACCVTLIKTDELAVMVQSILGPAAEYAAKK